MTDEYALSGFPSSGHESGRGEMLSWVPRVMSPGGGLGSSLSTTQLGRVHCSPVITRML